MNILKEESTEVNGEEKIKDLMENPIEIKENSSSHDISCLKYESKKEPFSKRNFLAFFLFGLANNFAYVIMLSAVDKILENQQTINTGIVLLCDIIPAITIKYTFPWFGHLIPYWIKIMIVVGLSTISFILVAAGKNVSVRLTGVTLASLCSGFGDPTFLGLTSFYEMYVLL
jgi:hypothetical protein